MLLNSLKLNLSAFVVFTTPDSNAGNIFVAVLTLIAVNVAPVICCIVLWRNKEKLEEEENRKSFGSLFTGRNIKQADHRIMLYPLAFFYRRTVFIVITVFMFDYPALQMIVNQLLTLFMIVYLIYESHSLFANRSQQIVEVGSEIGYLVCSLFLQEFTNLGHSQESLQAI